jgi:hypothetical protein
MNYTIHHSLITIHDAFLFPTRMESASGVERLDIDEARM